MKALNKRIAKAKYLLFIDLEGTQFTHEVISIGAYLAKLNKNGTLSDHKDGFYRLVKAKERITPFIVDFTGITQDMLERDGIEFAQAIKELAAYVGKAWANCLFVAYGHNDILMLKTSLAKSPGSFGLKERIEHIARHYLDFQSFSEQYIRDENHNTLSLQNMLLKFHIAPEGTFHNALDDAKNLMRIYEAFQKETEIVTDSYKRILSFYSKAPRPILRVLKMLNNGQKVEPSDYTRFIEEEILD